MCVYAVRGADIRGDCQLRLLACGPWTERYVDLATSVGGPQPSKPGENIANRENYGWLN
jgi:hypothetical protein